jgi:hypothetical protein
MVADVYFDPHAAAPELRAAATESLDDSTLTIVLVNVERCIIHSGAIAYIDTSVYILKVFK